MSKFFAWTGWYGSLRPMSRETASDYAVTRPQECKHLRPDGSCPFRREGFGCRDCVVDETTGEIMPRM